LSGRKYFNQCDRGQGDHKKILKYLGLWEIKARPPPRVTGPVKIQEYKIDYSTSQLPVSDKWVYVDPDYPEVYSFDLEALDRPV
jgi:hypothetical protein